MSDILTKYYHGITQQIRSEVDFINSLFQHQGLKGEGNETILRDLVRRFIPKQYGVSTGVVIDKHGHQSRQCDIIIYDTFLYPSLLSLSNIHLFPVDIVYATIEIKTTLNAQSSKEALLNISSIKNLDIITDEFILWEPQNGELLLKRYIPRTPIGMIFAYNSEAAKSETFKGWFIPSDEDDASVYPNLVTCLDQGFVKFVDVAPKKGMIPKGFAIGLQNDAGEPLFVSQPMNAVVYNGANYPVKLTKEGYLIIDQSRVLLNFVLLLNDLLLFKKINPSIRFSEHYLRSATTLSYEI